MPTLITHENPLFLASSSPRRKELIALLRIPYRIEPSRFDEPSPPDSSINLAEFVTTLAVAKAEEVARRCGNQWTLGADTIVSMEKDFGVPLGKPKDTEDAARMISTYAGRSHYVHTGIALIHQPKLGDPLQIWTHDEISRVQFRAMNPRMIADYIATGEPMDKAGAYGAQGFAAPYIEAIEGDFFSVMGLPLCAVGRLLERARVAWWEGVEV